MNENSNNDNNSFRCVLRIDTSKKNSLRSIEFSVEGNPDDDLCIAKALEDVAAMLKSPSVPNTNFF